MPLWGTSADASTNKPKWCPTDRKFDLTEVMFMQITIWLGEKSRNFANWK